MVYHYTILCAIIYDYFTIMTLIAIIAIIVLFSPAIIGIIGKIKIVLWLIFVHFGRWYNHNNREISEISEIIALLFHLCALFHDYCYPRVGHGALLGLAPIMSRLVAFGRTYSVAIIVYHYTRLWQACFCCNNANNPVIITK